MPRTYYQCTNCDAKSVRWEGRCPSCKEWNTLEEVVEEKAKPSTNRGVARLDSDDNKAMPLTQLKGERVARMKINFDTELDRVLGGGIVPGSVVLLGGQPGIGKSTLMLQLSCQLGGKVLYASGEESVYQIKMRADRLGMNSESCYLLAETQLQKIITSAKDLKPQLLLIDSIQTMYSSESEAHAGTVTQIRSCASYFQQFAKAYGIPVILIGHITKEGSLAGPKVLEHVVDVVLHFEGDRNHLYRILRATKNRFGNTDELGIYEMRKTGLHPVKNPSNILMSTNTEAMSGCAIAVTVEGVRALLVETQALVATAIFGNPQRSPTGFDIRRLNMLLAVLEKKCGLFFGQNDVFLNMVGGIKVNEPGIDLAVLVALVSSLRDIALDRKLCFAGEVGLTGEIRTVHRVGLRIQEAARQGFTEIIISSFHGKDELLSDQNIRITKFGKVEDLVAYLFG